MAETSFATIAATDADADAALDATIDWASAEPWPRTILPDGSGASYRDYANSLQAALRAKGLSGWADRFAGYADEHGDGGPGWRDDHISVLLDEAGIRIAMRATLDRLMVVVDELWEMAPIAGQNPVPILIDRLRGISSDHALCDKLGQYLGEIANSPRVRDIVERRSDHRTRDLWPGPYEAPIPHRWPFQVVARLWPERLVAMLSADVSLPIVHGAITAAGPYDLAALTALLVAGDHRDAASSARRGIDYALLAEIAPIMADLYGTSGQAGARSAAVTLLGALAARADWDLLSRAWLQQLIWHGSDRLPRRLTPESDWPEARNLLIEELCAAAPVLRQDVHNWINGEEDLWRVDRVLAEAGILAARGDCQAAADLLSRSILAGEITQTGREQAVFTDKPESTIVGSTIEGLSDSVSWFEQLWAGSYNARERGTFGHDTDYQDPADCILAWGFAGLVHTGDPQIQSRYWHSFTKAFAGRIVTDWAEAMPMRLRDTLVRGTLFLGANLRLKGIIQLSDLSQFLRFLIAPSPRFASCVAMLLAAGGETLVAPLAAEPGCGRLVDALGLGIAAAGSLPAGSDITPEQMIALRVLHRCLAP